MTPVDWFRCWLERFGKFPDDYLVIDTETTGLQHSSDFIVQIGWCEVRNRRVADNDGVVLDWLERGSALTDRQDFLKRLDRTRYYMESRGNRYPWTPAVIANGTCPLEALADLLVRLQDNSTPMIVTHNGWSFDVPMLESHFRRFLGQEYSFADDRMVDTGAIEKGSQIGITPYPGESFRTYTGRVMSKRTHTKWSLANHCVPKYNLDTRNKLDMNNAHTAPFDCLTTHLLLETYRSLLPKDKCECGSNSAKAMST